MILAHAQTTGDYSLIASNVRYGFVSPSVPRTNPLWNTVRRLETMGKLSRH